MNEGDLTVAQAASYFRRTALEMNGSVLSPGLHSPSEIYTIAHTTSGCRDPMDIWGLDALLQAIESGQVGPFIQHVRMDPLAPVPKELTPLELLNDQYRQAHGGGGSPTGPTATPLSGMRGTVAGNCAGVACPTPNDILRTMACQLEGSQAPLPPIPDAYATYDLDYVILVPGSARSTCCYNDVTGSMPARSKDPWEVLREMREETLDVELAAVTYSDSELRHLLTLLPLEYRNQSDDQLGLPPVLRDSVLKDFDDFHRSVAEAFTTASDLPPVKLTFNRGDVADVPKADYVAWFQALAASDKGLVYISPLLARAPFYVCYNHGVRDYVRGRYEKMAELQNQSQWHEWTAEDAKAVGEALRGPETQYRACVEAQLFFVVAHELGHVAEHKFILDGGAKDALGKPLLKDPNDDPYFAEVDADCFGYVSASHGKTVELGIFETVIEDATALMKARESQLDDLVRYFTDHPLPDSGESTVRFCHERAASYVQADRTAAHAAPP